MAKSRPYEESLKDSLKDPMEAVEYLKAALEESDPAVFLLALKDVAVSHGGMSEVARKAHLNRENLYRMLSSGGNPRINSLNILLRSLGLKLSVEMHNKDEQLKVA